MSETPVTPGIDREHFEVVLADFVEVNPMACEGLLGVCRLEYTSEVPTLAVTLREDPPRLLVNPDFLAEHVLSEEDAMAVLLHEFLHVLLGHTKLFKSMDNLTNLALDAVINHIVERELGHGYGDFFRRFYQPQNSRDPVWLLRPFDDDDIQPDGNAGLVYPPVCASNLRNTAAVRLHQLRKSLGEGRVLADDVLDLFEEAGITSAPGIVFVGNHSGCEDVHLKNTNRLNEILRQFNGSGVFRRPQDHGVGRGADAYENSWAAVDPWFTWRRETIRILRRVLSEDSQGVPIGEEEFSYLLPVPTAGDRRAVLRSIWNPILPDFSWIDRRPVSRGLANVYLDVSGSMALELEKLTGLLWQLRDWIRTPLHAFSDGVEPARIENGRLVSRTSGGTRFNEVLEHIAKHQPGKALVITDGYIEPINQGLLKRCRSARQTIEILVSADGSTGIFDQNRIPATRLPNIPS